MFEDSLMESTGRIRTRSRYFAVGSFAFQAMLLTALAFYPILHPAHLPKQAFAMLLTAPPPPAAPPALPQHAVTAVRAQISVLENPFTAPAHIPQHVDKSASEAPPSSVVFNQGVTGAAGPGGVLSDLIGPGPVVKPALPKGPMRVSSGVAAGLLVTPIQPAYPAIARSARIQGTVTVQAMIAKDGSIENLRVLSGPPMLQSAAVDAIRKARYRPFQLNGEPVEVETTINVIFNLSS